MNATTLDRDIRLSPEQIVYLAQTVRRRRNELGRSIARADANRRAGAKIQHGTYERHLNEINELSLVLESLEVARKQIAHRIARSLETAA